MNFHDPMSDFRRSTGIAAIAIVVCAMLGVFVGSPDAPAQGQPPTLEVTSHVLADTSQFTATISLDPGDNLGAISGALEYESSALSVIGCTVGELGVCHDGDDGVHFAVFAPNGFVPDSSLMVIDFAVVTPGLASDLVLTIDTSVTVEGRPTEPAVVVSGSVTSGALGGVNGEVLDGNNVGLFGMQVCASADIGAPACVTTTGLGAFVIEGLTSGDYDLAVIDPTGSLEMPPFVVTVNGSEVTTGISVTMVAPAGIEGSVITGPEGQVELASIRAEPGEIAVQLTAEDGGFPVFGVELCASVPVIGTQSCSFSDIDGIARVRSLEPGNYALSVSDPSGRFGEPETTFVGVNSSVGVVKALSLPAPDLGELPEALAFVDVGLAGSEGSALLMTAGALAAMSSGALVSRRRR